MLFSPLLIVLILTTRAFCALPTQPTTTASFNDTTTPYTATSFPLTPNGPLIQIQLTFSTNTTAYLQATAIQSFTYTTDPLAASFFTHDTATGALFVHDPNSYAGWAVIGATKDVKVYSNLLRSTGPSQVASGVVTPLECITTPGSAGSNVLACTMAGFETTFDAFAFCNDYGRQLGAFNTALLHANGQSTLCGSPGGAVVVRWAVYVPLVTVPAPVLNSITAASSSLSIASGSPTSTPPPPASVILPSSAIFTPATTTSSGSCSVTVSLFYSPTMVLVPAGYTVPGGGEMGIWSSASHGREAFGCRPETTAVLGSGGAATTMGLGGPGQ